MELLKIWIWGPSINPEGKAPGVAQSAGMTYQCMRGTVLPCHVALSKDTWLLVRVRPCGPSSTISERRSQVKMARADTFCSQGRGNWLCAWQIREQLQVKSLATSLDLMPKLRSFASGPSSTILVGPISHGRGACTACPSCLRVLCTCLRVPCLRLCVCQPACAGRYRARACKSLWCLRGPLVRECPALVCVCLPCACACAFSALGRHPQLQ
jgi:hypothetical protein